jgi:glycosyltransferase involved in cell wall biosynthesis
MTYFERPYQLERTLRSIRVPYGIDFDVVIVDDGSSSMIPVIHDLKFQVSVLKINRNDKHWFNPEPAYNHGIDFAIKCGADILVVQNAENYHVGNVVLRASWVKKNEWISFACFSINERTTFNDQHDIHAIIRSNNFGAGHDGQNAWYNHSIHRPVGYDFCAATRVENMIKLNGYDERFSLGMGYGDDDLLCRVRKRHMDFSIIDNPFVVHQWHYNGIGVPENKPELVERNRKLFNDLKITTGTRAHHLFTPDFDIVKQTQIKL